MKFGVIFYVFASKFHH